MDDERDSLGDELSERTHFAEDMRAQRDQLQRDVRRLESKLGCTKQILDAVQLSASSAVDEQDRLKRQLALWEAEAKRYAQNADYWKAQTAELRAQLAKCPGGKMTDSERIAALEHLVGYLLRYDGESTTLPKSPRTKICGRCNERWTLNSKVCTRCVMEAGDG